MSIRKKIGHFALHSTVFFLTSFYGQGIWHFDVHYEPFPSVIICFANYFPLRSKPYSSVLRFPCFGDLETLNPKLLHPKKIQIKSQSPFGLGLV